MKRIKILYIVPSLKLCNGVASYAMNYYKNMNKDDIQIDFLETANVHSEYFEEIKKSDGRVFSMERMNLKNFIREIKEIKRFFREHANEYQIVHCNLVNSGLFFLHYAKKYKIKIRILHSHATKYSDKFFKNIRNNILAYFTKKNANVYCACSKLAGDYMFKGKNYKIINNAIDIDKFKYNQEKRDKIRELENIKEDEYLIGNIGRLDPQKNQLFLIDIFYEYLKINKNAKLLLIGTGSLEEKIIDKIKKLNIENNVIMKKNLINVNEYLQAIDIFLLPSIYEGLPVVGIEAQSAGVPCLFSDKITREIKVNDNIEFIALDNINSWITEIEKYRKKYVRIETTDKIKERGYDIKIEALKLEEYYENIIK